MARTVQNSLLVVIGYILSPFSWWNDLLVNIPLAYGFALPFALVNDALFLPAFMIGYWLTNLLGFWLMHLGVSHWIQVHPHSRKSDILFSVFYTILIGMCVLLGLLPSPTSLKF